MKKLLIIFILFTGCIAQKRIHSEKFVYQNEDIYHVSSYQDITLLKWSDVKVLNIDSLTNQFLYLKTER